MARRLQPFRYFPEQRFSAFLYANRVFFIGFLLLVALETFLLLTNEQGQLLIAINGNRTEFWDGFFRLTTQLGEPIAYLISIAVIAAFRYRTAIFAAFMGIAVAASAGILKSIFAQKRPLKWWGDTDWPIVEALNRFPEAFENWGESSFPSGHTASAFALYGFLCFNVKRPKVAFTTVCIFLAVTVGFSRMYLLYHFLRDVAAGAVLGVLIAMVFYLLQWGIWRDVKWMDSGYYRKQ